MAHHALELEIAGLRRRQQKKKKEQTAEELQAAPRRVEALEGGVVLRRCVLKSEVGAAVCSFFF